MHETLWAGVDLKLDYGSFYAPKTQLDKTQRRILWGWITETRPESEYRPAGFPALLGLKDMNLVAEAAGGARVPMPLLGVIRDHLLQTIGSEGDDVDWAAIGKTISGNAGL